LNIRSDADFALRYMVADPFRMATDGGEHPPLQHFTEVYVQLRDESRKPYSNEPIHIDDLFGQGSPQSFADTIFPVFLPGFVSPEIYKPRESALYFDVYRDDSAFRNQFPVTIHFRFQGAKVFKR
jgi:hypothetical protein